MGTRSVTLVLNNSGEAFFALYNQYDGYIEGWGRELQEFLTDRVVGNGIGGEDQDNEKFSNGMDGLASQLAATFCKKLPGQFYIRHPDDTSGVSYIYEIYLDERSERNRRKQVKMRVLDYNKRVLYDGPARELEAPEEEEE